MADTAGLSEVPGAFGEFRIVDQHRRGAVGEDSEQFRVRQTPVQRNENRAEATAGKLHLERVGGVRCQDRDPVAGGDSVISPKRSGQPSDSLVEGLVGVVASGRQVHRGQRIRAPHRVMGDAVVIRDRHAVAPSGGWNTDRHRTNRAQDIGVSAGRRPDDLNRRQLPLEDFLPQDGQLHFRQTVADTAMDAETKRQMLARTRAGR